MTVLGPEISRDPRRARHQETGRRQWVCDQCPSCLKETRDDFENFLFFTEFTLKSDGTGDFCVSQGTTHVKFDVHCVWSVFNSPSLYPGQNQPSTTWNMTPNYLLRFCPRVSSVVNHKTAGWTLKSKMSQNPIRRPQEIKKSLSLLR